MAPKWFRFPSTAKSSAPDQPEGIPTESMWPEQRFFVKELLDSAPNECIYGRVDYNTMAHSSLSKSTPFENELVTRDGKHFLQAWRFIRKRISDVRV